MRRLMLGLSALAILVIGAYFGVALTPATAENENEISTPTPTASPTETIAPSPSLTPLSDNINISKVKAMPKEIVHIEVYAPDAEKVIVEIVLGPNSVLREILRKENDIWVGELKAPDETGVYNLSVLVNDKEVDKKNFEVVPKPQFSLSKEPVAPNMTVGIEVHAPYAENVVIEIDGSTYPLRKENETWIGEIKAPRETGTYNLTIFADSGKMGQVSLEVLPIWHVFLKKYRYWIAAIVFTAIIGLFFFVLYHRNNMEQRREKLKVQVRNEKDRGLKGAKVTVGSLKPKRTGETGMTDDFELPVGLYEVKVEKEGYKPFTFVREITRGENKEDVKLTPVEHIRKFLEVKVVDEEGKKVKGARVGILRGNKVLSKGMTDEWGTSNLEIPNVKGLHLFAQKEGYKEKKEELRDVQRQISLTFTLERETAKLDLTVFSEDNEPLSDAEVKIDDRYDFPVGVSGKINLKMPFGKHKLRITKKGYEPYERTLKVEGDAQLTINLTTKSGTLEVKVVDKEVGEPVEGIGVRVGGAPEITNKEGFFSFDKVPVGRQIIEVRDPTGVYSSEPKMVEIKEKITTTSKIKLNSSFEIPDSKMEKLRDAYKYLEDQRERVAAYDCYLPDYYMKVGEKLVEIVSDSGKSRKLLRLVREIRDIKPTVFVEDLADVISNGCMEIGKGMRERRNLEIFEDVKRFVVDKGLAKANVEVELKDAGSADIKKYIERGREGTEELLRDVDQSLTKTAGNIYPMSVLFKVARQIMTSDASSDDKAKALVASLILEYVRVMLNDENVEKRLRGLIT